MTPAGFTNVSAISRAGIYVLRKAGRTVWIGQAKTLNSKIYAHKVVQRGRPTPDWAPTKPIAFDEVLIAPCRIDELPAAYASACAAWGWTEPKRSPAHAFAAS